MKVFLNKRIADVGMDLLQHNDIQLIFPENENLSYEQWLNYCRECDAIISVGKSKYDAVFFEKCPNVKAIALFSVGYDHVDVLAATKHKVAISNTPEVLSNATADTAFLLMQMVARKAGFNLDRVKNGTWSNNFNPLENLGQELNGKILGIYGLGRIGFEMAKKCKAAFDMPIIYHNRRPNVELESVLNAKYVSFEELLEQSDVISLHANYSENDYKKFDKNCFSKMKSTAIFINTARGGFVNENDLYVALKEQLFFGAGLDVTEKEPLSVDSKLISLENICILPHIGSATIQARNGMSKLVAENIIAFAENKQMPTIINPEVYS